MKIAIVGAGIFGCTIAVELSNYFSVDLYDSANDIMTAASRTNQLRLHRGYHYPRSPETVSSLLSSIGFFKEKYKDAIIDDFEHYYCIAKEKSLVSSENYLNFCDDFNLEYHVIKNFECVNQEKVALTIKVKESLLDYKAIYEICKSRIKNSRINLKLNSRFIKKDIEKYDLVVNCTYANINDILDSQAKRNYQFELCEKICVQMPETMKNKSIVIMDGPFMCVDPYGSTGTSLLGNVVHAIHATNIGQYPIIPNNLKSNINKGILKNPSITNFKEFISTGKNYIPSLSMCSYIGSMYTIRAVLPNMDDTDGRPTIVSRPAGNIINVFSGKIDTCVKATDQIISQLVDKK